MIRNCGTVTELLASSAHQFRWLQGLKKAMSRVRRYPRHSAGFWFDAVLTVVDKEGVSCSRDGRLLACLKDVAWDGSCFEIYYLYDQIYPEYASLDQSFVMAE